MIFNGYRFEEAIYDISSDVSISVDIGIFVAGWEERSLNFIDRKAVSGREAILIDFKDDGIDGRRKRMAFDKLSAEFGHVRKVTIQTSLQREVWQNAIDALAAEVASRPEIITGFVDYTCMPKAITQTLYRSLLSKDALPVIHWGYSEGRYTKDDNNLSFDQGIRGTFFQIRHTPGSGGMASERAAILALGADEKLLIELLEGPNYDSVYVLSPRSSKFDSLNEKAQAQRSRLVREFHVPEGNFFACDALSVNSSLSLYLEIISSLGRDVAIEIFCSGPKTHAVAACAVAERFPRSVSILGRLPQKYQRHEVKATGSLSVSKVSNFKNPRIRFALQQRVT